MYYTGIDPESGKAVYVANSDRQKGLQKAMILWHQPEQRKKLMEGLREVGREDAAAELLSDRIEQKAGIQKKSFVRRKSV